MHVKDAARFPGKWAFFNFADGAKSSGAIPRAASCYACHSSHAAVDTTFVQFYPTLLPIAKNHVTLSRAYENDLRAAAASSKVAPTTRFLSTMMRPGFGALR